MPAMLPPEPAEWVDGVPIYKFPPFPDPPPGVTIIPFKDFKPSGIQRPALGFPDGIERDGEGIPTIKLAIDRSEDMEHTQDPAKKKKKRNKKKGAPKGPVMVDGRALSWWEVWDLQEGERSVQIDPGLPKIDRFLKAAVVFESGRPLNSDNQSIYDSMALFFGVKSRQLQAPLSKHLKKLANDADYSDDECEPATPPTQGDGGEPEREAGAHSADENNRLSYSEAVDPRDQDEFEKQVDEEEDMKVNRMDQFFDDPVYATKVFLSSHFKDKGLIWSNVKLINGPIVVSFFHNFLLRNKVLPECATKLEAVLEVTERAKTELPATGELGVAMPGGFSKIATATWGLVAPSMVGPSDNGAGLPVAAPVNGQLNPETPAEEPQPADPDVQATVTGGGGWGSGIIGTSDNEADGFLQADANEQQEIPPNPWDSNADLTSDPTDPWTLAKEATKQSWAHQGPALSFMQIFGPVSIGRSLGHLYKPGLVEESVRSIGKIFVDPQPELKDGETQATRGPEGWEQVKDWGLSVVMMKPWRRPKDCKLSPETKIAKLPAPYWPDPEAKIQPEDDSRKATIPVLMEPTLAKLMISGMLVAGVFVKLVPNEEGGQDEAGIDIREWWYIESVVGVLPSYYAENEAEHVRALTSGR